MPIPYTVDSLDGIDEKYHDLYVEKDGKFVAAEVTGVRTDADVTRVTTALNAERTAHKNTKAAFSALDGKDISEVVAQLDRIPELEAAAAGKLDDAGIDKIVETRLSTKIAPLQRELDKTRKELGTATETIGSLTGEKKTRTLHEIVRSAAVKAGVLPSAIDDAVMLAERVLELDDSGAAIVKEGSGFTAGLDATVWLTDLREKRAHWWGPSEGGGSTTGNVKTGGVNPFTDAHWNMTAQGQLYKTNPAQAEQMAKAAGTTIGGRRPPKKS